MGDESGWCPELCHFLWCQVWAGKSPKVWGEEESPGRPAGEGSKTVLPALASFQAPPPSWGWGPWNVGSPNQDVLSVFYYGFTAFTRQLLGFEHLVEKYKPSISTSFRRIAFRKDNILGKLD